MVGVAEKLLVNGVQAQQRPGASGGFGSSQFSLKDAPPFIQELAGSSASQFADVAKYQSGPANQAILDTLNTLGQNFPLPGGINLAEVFERILPGANGLVAGMNQDQLGQMLNNNNPLQKLGNALNGPAAYS